MKGWSATRSRGGCYYRRATFRWQWPYWNRWSLSFASAAPSSEDELLSGQKVTLRVFQRFPSGAPSGPRHLRNIRFFLLNSFQFINSPYKHVALLWQKCLETSKISQFSQLEASLSILKSRCMETWILRTYNLKTKRLKLSKWTWLYKEGFKCRLGPKKRKDKKIIRKLFTQVRNQGSRRESLFPNWHTIRAFRSFLLLAVWKNEDTDRNPLHAAVEWLLHHV